MSSGSESMDRSMDELLNAEFKEAFNEFDKVNQNELWIKKTCTFSNSFLSYI